MHIVIALGGNALLKRSEALEANILQKNIRLAAKMLSPLVQQHHLTFVHGNGPQVGLLALQADTYKEVQPYPFDILGAESQGQIGYLLQQALGNLLPNKSIVTLITQVIVDANDPAFLNPTKPIGPIYSFEQANSLKKQKNWQIKADGKHFRRVVPSPIPQHIFELDTIKTLITAGHYVIAGGGGGIPCILDHENHLKGVEAVVDKDLTASKIAQELNADALMILTDVDAVYENWEKDTATPIHQINIASLEKMSFPEGSMQPKVTAACQFVKNTQKPAMIGSLLEVESILAGQSGTLIIF